LAEALALRGEQQQGLAALLLLVAVFLHKKREYLPPEERQQESEFSLSGSVKIIQDCKKCRVFSCTVLVECKDTVFPLKFQVIFNTSTHRKSTQTAYSQ
jgi:hypothetical protein